MLQWLQSPKQQSRNVLPCWWACNNADGLGWLTGI